MNKIRPIFVTGYMRSGTTLMYKILGNHSEVYARRAESKIFESFSIIRKAYPDLANDEILESYAGFISNVIRFRDPLKQINQPFVDNSEFNLADLHKALLDINVSQRDHLVVLGVIFDKFAQKAGKSFWVTKAQVLEVQALVKSIPEAMFVEIIRDPRDVLSAKKSDRDAVWASERYKTEKRAYKDLINTYDPFWDSLSWKAEARAGKLARQNFTDKYYFVRYEDLVNHPREEVEKMCSFLNLDFSPQMIEIEKRNSSDWDKKYTGIGSESVGKWRKKLTPAEVVLCQWAVREEMIYFGYHIAEYGRIEKIKSKVLLVNSGFEFILRLVRKYKLGGWAYFISVFNSYLKKLKFFK